MSRSLNDTLFFYQRDKLVSLRQGSQQRTILRSADFPLAEWQAGDTSERGLLAIDEKGSVLEVQVANEAEQHHYSAYGHAPNLPSALTSLSFTGEHCYLRLGAYLLGKGQRAYQPTLMRFFSPDYLSPFAAGGLNAYGYCNGDPINQIDPSGTSPIKFRAPASNAPVQKPAYSQNAAMQAAQYTSSAPLGAKSALPQQRQLDSKTQSVPYRPTDERAHAELIMRELSVLEPTRSALIKEVSKLNAGILEKQIIHQFVPRQEKTKVAQLRDKIDIFRKKINASNDELKKIRG